MEDEIMETMEETTVTEAADPETAEQVQPQTEEVTPAEPQSEQESQEHDAVLEELQKAKQEAEEKAAELEEQMKRQNALLGRVSDASDPTLEVVAQALGVDPEELEAAVNEELENDRLEAERKTLKEEVEQLKLEKVLEADLVEIQKIDPNVKNLVDLGDPYFKCVAAGMSAAEAYHASKYIAKQTTPTAPAEIGKVNQSSVQKDFYTKEEVEAMTAEEVEQNLPKIELSMKKWK